MKKNKKEIMIFHLKKENFRESLFCNIPILNSYLVYYCDQHNIFYEQIIDNVAFCENICYIAVNT